MKVSFIGNVNLRLGCDFTHVGLNLMSMILHIVFSHV